MKKFYLFAIALLSLASCQQEDIATNGMYSDDFMAKLEFNTVKVAGTRAEGKQATNKNNEVIKNNEDLDICIFSVRIARASRNCLSGFGFCDFVWFPKQPENDVEKLIESNPLYKNSFRIQRDKGGNKFVDLELSKKPAGLDISKLQPLVVEENLESFSTVNEKEEKMTVPKGSYSFDSSIGKFGGYRIPLK